MPASKSDPAAGAEAVTPSDAGGFAGGPALALYVGTGGDVTLVLRDGTPVAFANVPDGTVLPVQCARVNSTGTTASDIVALR